MRTRNNNLFIRAPSPKTPDNTHERKHETENEKLLSPFSIDTPNRIKFLKYGLPRKHRSVLGAGAFGTVYKVFYKGVLPCVIFLNKFSC